MRMFHMFCLCRCIVVEACYLHVKAFDIEAFAAAERERERERERESKEDVDL